MQRFVDIAEFEKLRRDVERLKATLQREPQDSRGQHLDELEALINKAPYTPLRFCDIQRRFGISRRALENWRHAWRHNLPGKKKLQVYQDVPSQTTARWLWEAIDGRTKRGLA